MFLQMMRRLIVVESGSDQGLKRAHPGPVVLRMWLAAKGTIRWCNPSALVLVLASIAVVVATSPAGAALSWDANGTADGSGNVGGDWTGNNWNANSAGTAATGPWAAGEDAIFSAGTDGVGS